MMSRSRVMPYLAPTQRIWKISSLQPLPVPHRALNALLLIDVKLMLATLAVVSATGMLKVKPSSMNDLFCGSLGLAELNPLIASIKRERDANRPRRRNRPFSYDRCSRGTPRTEAVFGRHHETRSGRTMSPLARHRRERDRRALQVEDLTGIERRNVDRVPLVSADDIHREQAGSKMSEVAADVAGDRAVVRVI